MGLPIGKLVCASNANDVLDDFIRTGTYDANRPFMKTNSPSMDILISSNLERFLYFMSGRDGAAVTADMQALAKDGRYSVADAVRENMAQVLASGAENEAQTLAIIGDVFAKDGYLLDTHTAVAVGVAEAHNKGRVMVVDSTANPYKFVGAVSEAVNGEKSDASDLDLLGALAEKTGVPVHPALADLTAKPRSERHVITTAEINEAVLGVIKSRK